MDATTWPATAARGAPGMTTDASSKVVASSGAPTTPLGSGAMSAYGARAAYAANGDGASPPRSGDKVAAQCGFVDAERGSNASSTESLRTRETCRDFLKGACFRDNCRYAHDAVEGAAVPAQTAQPVCRDYQNGRCFRASCRFYHGTSAEQASAQIGANSVAQMFNNAHAMYGMSHIGAQGAVKNPQLHLMNRTMNLQNGFDGTGQFDQLQFGQNLTLDQAVFLQAAVANGAYDSNHMLTAAAMASEILRRSGAGHGPPATGFDLSWMTTQQQMAAAAAAAAAAASGDASANMYNNGNTTLQMQQQHHHYASAVNNGGDMMNGGYVPHQPMSIPHAAQSQYSSWPTTTNGVRGVERQQSKSSDISALPDSLVDSELSSSVDLTSFHTEYAGFGSGTWS